MVSFSNGAVQQSNESDGIAALGTLELQSMLYSSVGCTAQVGTQSLLNADNKNVLEPSNESCLAQNVVQELLDDSKDVPKYNINGGNINFGHSILLHNQIRAVKSCLKVVDR